MIEVSAMGIVSALQFIMGLAILRLMTSTQRQTPWLLAAVGLFLMAARSAYAAYSRLTGFEIAGYTIFHATASIVVLILLYLSIVRLIPELTKMRNAQEALHQREERYRTLVERAPVAILVTDENGRIVESNATACSLLGYGAKEIRTMRLKNLIGPGDYSDPLVAADNAGFALGKERPIRRRDGSTAFVEINVAVLTDGSKQVLLHDITERRRSADTVKASEARFRAASEACLDAFFLLSSERAPGGAIRDFRFTYLNARGERLIGVEKEKGIGRRLCEVFPAAKTVGLFEKYAKVVESREPIEEEFLAQDAKNRQRWIHHQVVPLADGVAVTSRDVTQRKQDEAARVAAEQKYRGIFENAIEGIFQSTPDGAFLTANPAMARILGYPSAQSLMRSIQDIGQQVFHDPREYLRYRNAVEARDVYEGFETQATRLDGGLVWVSITARVVRDADGKPLYYEGTAEDISERKHAELERERLESQMLHAQKLESLGVLAGGIAHDFNNLLVGVMGNAGIALMDLPIDSPVRESIAQIEKAAQRAAELTRQMLAYAGKGKFVVQPIDLSLLVQEMAKLLEVSISKKATLQYRLANNLPAIEADATQIRQVVMNLITNASDAIGGRQGNIWIVTGEMDADRNYLAGTILDDELPEGKYVFVEVRDSGAGMDALTMAKIFDPFFTTKFTGRGLGLAAVLGIVRGHKGAIKVYSEPGRGTTFKILFPAIESPLQTIERANIPGGEWQGAGVVLVVDDDEEIRRVAQRVLEMHGFEVLTASEGKQGIDRLKRNLGRVKLVLLDLTMPVMGGEEAFVEMRRLNPELPIILCSGYNEQDTVEHFAGKGLAGFLQKPFPPQLLLERVRAALPLEPTPLSFDASAN